MLNLARGLQWGLCACLVLLLQGCAVPARDVGKSADEFVIQRGVRNDAVDIGADGVHLLGTGEVAVKYAGKGALALIDELAYRVGFNYTVLSDISRLKVDINACGDHPVEDVCKNQQAVFKDASAAIRTIAAKVNGEFAAGGTPDKIQFRLKAEWRADGLQLQLVQIPPGPCNGECVMTGKPVCSEVEPQRDAARCERMSFKKLFFKNISCDEGAQSLADLFRREVVSQRSQPAPTLPGSAAGNGFQSGVASYQPLEPSVKDDTRASIIRYRAQNALLVYAADRDLYDRIAQVFPSLDGEFQQVIVETQVYEYDDSVANRLGAALQYSKETASQSGNTQKLSITSQFGESISNALPNLFYQMTNVEKKAVLLANLALYDRDGLVRILAEPRLVMKSGEAAAAKFNTSKWYLTSGVNTAGDLRELPTGFELKVIPTVLGRNKVQLELEITQKEFIPSNDPNAVATINSNMVHTSIIAHDREVVSIGGILTKKDSKFTSGMAGIRKIPGLGALFGSEAYDRSVTRVEFLIRPTFSNVREQGAKHVDDIVKANCRIGKNVGNQSADCRADSNTGQTIDNDSFKDVR